MPFTKPGITWWYRTGTTHEQILLSCPSSDYEKWFNLKIIRYFRRSKYPFLLFHSPNRNTNASFRFYHALVYWNNTNQCSLWLSGHHIYERPAQYDIDRLRPVVVKLRLINIQHKRLTLCVVDPGSQPHYPDRHRTAGQITLLWTLLLVEEYSWWYLFQNTASIKILVADGSQATFHAVFWGKFDH